MNSAPFPLPASLPPTETLFYPSSTTNSSSSSVSLEPDTFLLFLPGNPGLIEYYRSFLSTLSKLLNRRINILGVSHAGFHTRQTAARGVAPWYWTLEEQIAQKLEIIEWLSKREWEKREKETQTGKESGGDEESGSRADRTGRGKNRGIRIIIAGHSVGAFIAMEVLRILGERRKRRIVKRDERVEIFGGIMLFPTIMEIAKSPSGKILSGLLHITSHLPTLVSALSSTLIPLPARLLHLLIMTITRQPPAASATTLSLLTTPGAVFQALSMAQDEIAEITTDRWNTDVWGSEKTGGPRLMFYFGQNDHWVANTTRDAIIKSRGRGLGEDWKPKMIVCEDDLPHGFCIEHGEEMAEKVMEWLEGMLDIWHKCSNFC